jgi:hypothetical protein
MVLKTNGPTSRLLVADNNIFISHQAILGIGHFQGAVKSASCGLFLDERLPDVVRHPQVTNKYADVLTQYYSVLADIA